MKLCCLLILLCTGLHVAAQTYATTDDGRRVVLNDDSTWRCTVASETVNEDTTSKRIVFKSASSKNVQASVRNKFSVAYNGAKWKLYDKKINDLAEFSFINTGQFAEAYCMVITERVAVSFASLKTQVLLNSKANIEHFSVTRQEYITVNNHKVLHMVFGGVVKEMDVTYDGYYSTGPSGIIQVVCFTTKNLFTNYEKDFDDLLNGLTESL